MDVFQRLICDYRATLVRLLISALVAKRPLARALAAAAATMMAAP